MNNKDKVLVTLIIISSMIIAVEIILLNPTPKQPERQVIELPLDDIVDEETKLHEECNNSRACIERELIIKANQEQDLTYCEKISDLVMAETCRNQVIYKRVSTNQDPSECNKFSEEFRDECKDLFYESRALKEGDIDYCYKISDTRLSNSCHDSFFQEEVGEGNCDLLWDKNTKDVCWYYVAIELENDSTTCQKIDNESTKEDCLDILEENE